MQKSQAISEALTRAFSPTVLTVEDQSEQHRGHSGFREGGQTHFKVVIRAPAFAAMSRIARHRAVHSALGAELVASIHALALDVA